MNNQENKNSFDIIKMSLGWVLSFVLRLIPFRPPNLEPILAIQMPFTKKFGFMAGFLFAFLNIILFDLVTGKVGMWTWVTAVAYGLLALFTHWYFKNRKSTSVNYAVHAIFATLIYDAITGLTVGPIFFGQSFMSALSGQAIFTVYHLVGNVSLALLFSQIIYKFLVTNPKLSISYLKYKFVQAQAL
ncbi:MAG: hypothetical protein WC719_01050 [Patescibacteria group bacterium]|jgi:uncharacterized membrane protein